MVSVNGTPAVMAIIEELTPKYCRLRSINAFKVGDHLLFDFTLRGAKMLELTGTVQSSAMNGTRRSYVVALEAAEEDDVVAALDAAQRFAVAHPRRDVPSANGLTRASARIPVDMEVEYRLAGGTSQSARATNVSAGGVLFNSMDAIAVGSAVELRFRLPGATHILSVHARVVAHQHESPNYNMAFFNIDPKVREELEAFVSAHSRQE
jgi:hypothetical protein